MKKINIAVIGAGVIGLTAAVRLQSGIKHANVTLITEYLSPNTTGDGSAGLWGPFLSGDTPAENINHWSDATHKLCHYLWKQGKAEEAGICLLPVYRLTTENSGYLFPEWSHVVYGCQLLNEEQIKNISQEHGNKYTGGIHFVSFTLEPTKFLPYLLNIFLENGGALVQKKILNIKELSNYDILINCTGIGAKYLVKDSNVNAIRGQVTRVEAPWIFQVFLDDSDVGNYIIPNTHSVVLGGTHQEGDFNRKVDLEDSEFIYGGCSNMVQSLKNAKVIQEWVGLRPGRNQVRLELDFIEGIPVIHNYGHGGCGVTLSWGCAGDVVKIASDFIGNNPRFANSKL